MAIEGKARMASSSLPADIQQWRRQLAWATIAAPARRGEGKTAVEAGTQPPVVARLAGAERKRPVTSEGERGGLRGDRGVIGKARRSRTAGRGNSPAGLPWGGSKGGGREEKGAARHLVETGGWRRVGG